MTRPSFSVVRDLFNVPNTGFDWPHLVPLSSGDESCLQYYFPLTHIQHIDFTFEHKTFYELFSRWGDNMIRSNRISPTLSHFTPNQMPHFKKVRMYYTKTFWTSHLICLVTSGIMAFMWLCKEWKEPVWYTLLVESWNGCMEIFYYWKHCCYNGYEVKHTLKWFEFVRRFILIDTNYETNNMHVKLFRQCTTIYRMGSPVNYTTPT